MTLEYPDISGYDAGISLTGMAAVVVKATEGTSYTNPDYARVASDATSRGLPWAAYHWIHHGTSASAQADHFHSVAGNAPCMLDVEKSGDFPNVQDCLDFSNRLNQLGGHVRLVYFPNWYWKSIGSPDLTPLARAGMALVSSNYPSAGYSDNGPGWAAYGGVAPDVWQYTDAHQLNGFTVDMNAYRGTAEEFRALLNGGTEMALTDIVPGTSSPGMGDRDLGTCVGDIWNVLMKNKSAGGGMWPGSPFAILESEVSAIQSGQTTATLTDAQLNALVTQVTAGVVAAHPSLNDADKPTIEAAVRDVLHGA